MYCVVRMEREIHTYGCVIEDEFFLMIYISEFKISKVECFFRDYISNLKAKVTPVIDSTSKQLPNIMFITVLIRV